MSRTGDARVGIVPSREQGVFRVGVIERHAHEAEVVEGISVEHAGSGAGAEDDPLEVLRQPGSRPGVAQERAAKRELRFLAVQRPTRTRGDDVERDARAPAQVPVPRAAWAMRRHTALTSPGAGRAL